MLVMVAVLLAAGCVGCALSPTGCIEPGYVANHDIVVVKLTPNGSLSWYKVIDTGGDDTADGIIPTSDAGFVITSRLSDINRQSGRYPYLVKFSHDGNFVWNRSIYELNCDSGVLTNTQKGEILIVSGNLVCWFNSDGELISNQTLDYINSGNVIIPTNDSGNIIAGISEEEKPFTKEEFISTGRSESYWYELCGNITPPVNPYCGGNHTVIHSIIVKLDRNGSIVWHHSLREYGFTQAPTSVIELKNNQGYIITVRDQLQRQYSISLDLNGNYINATPLETVTDITPSGFRDLHWEYKDIPYNWEPNQVVFFNREGNAIARQILYNTSLIIARTDDYGYLSAGFPGSAQFLSTVLYHRGTEGNLHVVKLSPDGTLQWDMAIPNVTANKVVGIIQTSDGGYAILCESDKVRSTK